MLLPPEVCYSASVTIGTIKYYQKARTACTENKSHLQTKQTAVFKCTVVKKRKLLMTAWWELPSQC